MNSPFKSKPPGVVLFGIKTLLASGAIAGTIGIWSLLSNQAVSAKKLEDTDLAGLDQNEQSDIMGVPTLVSLINPEDLSTPEAVQAALPPSLRSVSALPTATAVVQAAPVQTMNLSGGSSGSQGGGSSKKASRKKSAAKSRSS